MSADKVIIVLSLVVCVLFAVLLFGVMSVPSNTISLVAGYNKIAWAGADISASVLTKQLNGTQIIFGDITPDETKLAYKEGISPQRYDFTLKRGKSYLIYSDIPLKFSIS